LDPEMHQKVQAIEERWLNEPMFCGGEPPHSVVVATLLNTVYHLEAETQSVKKQLRACRRELSKLRGED
jgi:hypothetical protein